MLPESGDFGFESYFLGLTPPEFLAMAQKINISSHSSDTLPGLSNKEVSIWYTVQALSEGVKGVALRE